MTQCCNMVHRYSVGKVVVGCSVVVVQFGSAMLCGSAMQCSSFIQSTTLIPKIILENMEGLRVLDNKMSYYNAAHSKLQADGTKGLCQVGPGRD